MKIQQNIIFGLLIAILFIAIETIFRTNFTTLINMLKVSEYFTIVILFIFLSFANNLLSRFFLIFITVMFIFEIGHFNYFGYFIFPMEFILFLTKSGEIYETLATELELFIEPLFYLSVLFIGIFYVDRL